MIHSFIFTGFLGVGKTTMLRNTVEKHFANKKVALIVNEFGEVGIDGNVLSNVHSEVLEIAEGCICCQLSDEFSEGVKEIIQKHDPEIILVETSGASEPFPIFSSLHALGISVEGVICVIDAKNFNLYKDNVSAQNQIGGSNIIVLNKTDLVSTEELQEVEEAVIAAKNKHDIKDALSGKAIFNGFLLEHVTQGHVSKKVFEGLYKVNDLIEIHKEELHQHHNHTLQDAITQKVAYIKKGTSPQEINTLLSALPKNVYRAKGIVKLKGMEKPQLINYAFGCMSHQDLDEYDGDSMFIFIGEEIEKDINFLAKIIDCLVLPQFTLKP